MIDVNVLVGATPDLRSPEDYGLAATVGELRAHGIAHALIASRTGVAHRSDQANEEAFAAPNQTTDLELRPVAVLNPVQCLDAGVEVARALERGASAFRFFPAEQGWTVDSVAFREIAEPAARGGRPFLISVGEFGSATRIGAATADLGVPVVLVGGHYSQLADCLAAMRRWPHLFLETSRLGQYQGVTTVVREVGAHRLLFGSGAPYRPIMAPLNAVLAAPITAEERSAILAGNAARLFEIDARVEALPSAVRGADLIDVHGHFGAFSLPVPRVEPDAWVADMARHGITRTVASSIDAIQNATEPGNREAFATASASGGALLAYVVVNPHDLEGSCRAMDQAYRSGAAVGAKVHCQISRQPTAGAPMRALLREIARRERPCLIHVDGPDWAEALVATARDFPGWRVIVAHGGPGTASLEGARAVEQTSNIYYELSTTFPCLPLIREALRRVGPARLLFGSDAPLIDPGWVLGIYQDGGADLGQLTAVAREVFDL